ncbi:MAG: hypothetical protein HQL52_08455 [Magnetococcales bacterium]|nr:hypothetical protein [Magnetococcales bacterium]
MDMEKLQEQWLSALDKIDALSKRERIQLLVTLCVVLGGGWYSLYVEPLEIRYKEITEKRKTILSHIREMSGLTKVILIRAEQNPDADNQKKKRRLKRELAALAEELEVGYETLVPPEDMPEVLKRFLDRNSGLRLKSMEAVEAEPMGGDDNKDKEEDQEREEDVLFRHGLELELVGGFPETVAFLKDLENAPWRIFWDEIEYVVDQYPQAQIKLEVYTLSLSTDLIGG